MTCALCQSVAFYRAGGVGYCEAHRAHAVQHATRLGRERDAERSERERQQKVWDVTDQKHGSAKWCSKFSSRRRG